MTQKENHRIWYILCRPIPPPAHLKPSFVPVLLLNNLCKGRLRAVLITIIASARANSQTLTVKSCHISTRIGYPVSFIFLSMVVMAIIVNAIQNSM